MIEKERPRSTGVDGLFLGDKAASGAGYYFCRYGLKICSFLKLVIFGCALNAGWALVLFETDCSFLFERDPYEKGGLCDISYRRCCY